MVEPIAPKEEGVDGESKGPKADKNAPVASLKDMFMLADKDDFVLMVAGIMGALVNGTGDPIMMVFFASSLSELSASADSDTVMKAMEKIAIYMTLMGVLLWFAGFVQYSCFTAFSKRLSQKLRERWFKAVIRQDIGWFDVNSPGEMPGRISTALIAYEEGMGPKLAEAVQFFSTLITGWALGFFFNAYVSLVVLGLVPLVGYSVSLLIKTNQAAAEFKDTCYAKANAIAFEVMGSLRTLLSFNGTSALTSKYYHETLRAEEEGIRRSWLLGYSNGFLMVSFILMYAVICVFGTWMLQIQVRHNGCDPSQAMDDSIRNKCDEYFDLPGEVGGQGVLIALLCIAFGGQAMGSVATGIEAFTTARQSCLPGFEVIKRVPPIDSSSSEGHSASSISGDIIFTGVDFSYPSRPDVKVCQNFSLTIPKGKTVALVGESGSGKSTAVGLVQRFYDPAAGSISLDGVDLKDWNVKNLRSHMSLVGQEPRLFTGTILENIRNGCHNQPNRSTPVTRAEIEQAAKMANAHDFIMKFPEGYDTQVGFGGSQMSGGQKQRIAIARAIIKNPKILLLDEATSALDNQSERVVQAALNKLVKDGGGERTTIIIAHRLSTIRNADIICVIDNGSIVEQGSHEELMSAGAKGNYKALITAQSTTVDNVADIPNSTSVENLADLEAEPMPVRASVGQKGVEMVDVEKGGVVADGTNKGDKAEEEAEYVVSWTRLKELNQDDVPYFLMGIFGALLVGGGYPMWGIVFGWMMELFFTPVYCTSDDDAVCQEIYEEEADDMWARAMELCYWWVGIFIIVFAGNMFLFVGFGTASERLSRRIRDLMFAQYVRQEPGYFDLPENSVGAVCGRLATDATYIKAKTGEPLQQTFVCMASIGTGTAIAAIYCWPICLLSIGTLPIVGYSMQIQMEVQMGTGDRVKGESAESLAIVGETVNAVRTVVSLGIEDHLIESYTEKSRKSLDGLKLLACKKGAAVGFAVAINHWNWALLMWFGGWLLSNHGNLYSFLDFNIALFGFFFGLFGLAAAGEGAAGAQEVKRAMRSVFELLDRETKIDPTSTSGTKLDTTNGSMALKDVNFTYPARPDLQVCNGYSLPVGPGTSVGLVGQSGSGKSTAIQLLERFYDPDAGEVSMDSTSLKDLNYQSMHAHIGYVGQEPILYKGSIAENIWMGDSGVTGDNAVENRAELIKEAQSHIEECAKEANAHNFIMEFPEGYDTDVGTGGERLSGGQKQRVAIARALMCNPKVLLLDEATSALDTESEKLVQAALDKLVKGKQLSSVTIAHRLSTVADLDTIHVVSKGTIVESGSHSALMAMNGHYAELAQSSAAAAKNP